MVQVCDQSREVPGTPREEQEPTLLRPTEQRLPIRKLSANVARGDLHFIRLLTDIRNRLASYLTATNFATALRLGRVLEPGCQTPFLFETLEIDEEILTT